MPWLVNYKSVIHDGFWLVMKRTLWKSWMVSDSKWEGSTCRNVSFHVFMAGSRQVVVYWLWHPLFCRWIPMYCSNTLSAWAVISWASPLLNSHQMCPWKGLIFSLHVPPRWCNLPYFKLPLTLALNRVIFSHSFVHAYINIGALKRVHFISWLCIPLLAWIIFSPLSPPSLVLIGH